MTTEMNILTSLRSLSALVILCAGLLGTGSPLQAQDCGGGSPLRIFASTKDAAGQTTVWEVDVLSGTFQQVLQTGDPLTSGTYEPGRDRLYFGSQGGGIYRFAPDGGGYEEVLPSGRLACPGTAGGGGRTRDRPALTGILQTSCYSENPTMMRIITIIGLLALPATGIWLRLTGGC